MNKTTLSNGDIQVGDYKYRIGQEYCTVVFIVTERCQLHCSYCLGWNRGPKDALTDRLSPKQIANHFAHLQRTSGKKLYVNLTGGEPSIITKFVELSQELTKYVDIELQTNLCTKNIQKFALAVNPKRVGQVMASYHNETLSKNLKLRQLYFKNFALLTQKGFTVILKYIALPAEIPQLENKIAWLRKYLPKNTTIFIQPFISGRVGPKNNPGSYPYKYSSRQRQTLKKVVRVRQSEVFDYIGGAGWFKGMKCDAGRGFIVMDKVGNASKCYTFRKYRLGNLLKRNIKLLPTPQPCTSARCSTPFWGLWYGVNPWKYLNKNKANCQYCRFEK